MVGFTGGEFDVVVFSGEDGGLMTMVTLNGVGSDLTVAGSGVIPAAAFGSLDAESKSLVSSCDVAADD